MTPYWQVCGGQPQVHQVWRRCHRQAGALQAHVCRAFQRVRSSWKVCRQGHEADCCGGRHQDHHAQGCLRSHNEVCPEGTEEKVNIWQPVSEVLRPPVPCVDFSCHLQPEVGSLFSSQGI